MIKFTNRNLISGLRTATLAKSRHLTVKTAMTRKFSLSCRAQNKTTLTEEEKELLIEPRARDYVDVCIVGGGPAGLATAIKLKQLDNSSGTGQLRVVVLEKSSVLGGQTVSGAILEPGVWNELFPDENFGTGIPLPKELATLVTKEHLKFLKGNWAISVPEPSQMVNKGRNYIVSLNQVVGYLGEKAEEVGVEVYPGIAVSDLIYDKNNAVKGVITKDAGISKSGKPKETFERGMEFWARQTVLAEGCHGSLTKQALKKYDLRKGRQHQTYGLGIKEVWEVKPENFNKGFAAHTMGYPLTNDVYGGGFQYHFGDGLVTVGLVVGLDYKNPYVSPYKEFQKMKHHPYYSKVLEGGKCIAYAARALNEGGLQSVPKLNFPGGVLVGASAGFMNVPKIKGTHTAMKSGLLAAESIFESIKELPVLEEIEDEDIKTDIFAKEETINLESYESAFKKSSIYKELYEVRNIRPSFSGRLGGYGGMIYSGIDSLILKGKVPWTLKFDEKNDGEILEPAAEYKPIEYPKPDGIISFDILTSVSRTGTYHGDDEPCHLRVPGQDMVKYAERSFPVWKGVESRFCPAGVYEFVNDEKSSVGTRLQINSQNCIHCKTCDIKAPRQDITWEVPEGGDGPKYTLT
ncbi:electron-transferring-flavoprotein dehydrogenase [Saccharomyces paradoxus]|uniref:Electron transfer flavoprotein-ubiquinone oxidoreductase n=1 Tax=Saccharomyces paradoxus TaxID=27291 RepID=A0A8B8V0G5_SACPA|nr:Cir2 [Saccharomyces paradoxus]QHS76431.1 Cir2 [Saccharomyces paradoxus]